jgi:hypothetical protein
MLTWKSSGSFPSVPTEETNSILGTSTGHYNESRSTTDPLVVVAYAVQTTIQIFAFLDLVWCAVDTTYKRGTLHDGNDYMIWRGSKLREMTDSRVRSYAHWCILAVLEFQLVSKLQSEILINVVKSLQQKRRYKQRSRLDRWDGAPVCFLCQSWMCHHHLLG